MSPPDLHTLVGPYVLDALPPQERERFESHLSQCPECRAEADELLAAAAHLGQAASVVPPATLREQVLAEVARTRQVAPGEPIVLDDAHRRRWVTPMLAAAGLLVVLAIAAVAIGQDHRADDAEQIAAITAAADAQTVVVAGDGGEMRLVVSDSHDSAVVVADGMAPPPDGKTYAIWYNTDGAMVLHGTFEPDEDGAVRERVDGVPSDIVGITVEDADDTPQEPTFPTVAQGSI